MVSAGLVLAGHHFTHLVRLCSLEEEGLALRTSEVVDLTLAVAAVDLLTQIGFFEEDGGVGLVAEGTLPEGPEDEAALLVAEAGGECPLCVVGGLGGSLALGTVDLVHLRVYYLS